ncbi:hypothetical protein D3C75_741620 [compost metagenome]
MIQLVIALKHHCRLLRILEGNRQLLLRTFEGSDIVRDQDILVDLALVVQIRHNRHMEPNGRWPLLDQSLHFPAPDPSGRQFADDLFELKIGNIKQFE